MAIDLSIIIVTYNPGEVLYDCLGSLSLGVRNLSVEVIVIDNSSNDGVPQVAADKLPLIQFVFNSENKGFAGANNQGLVLSKGRFLALINPDVIVQLDSLFKLVEYLRDHSRVGIVGPRTLDAKGRVSLTGNVEYTPLTILWQYMGFDRLFPNHVYGRLRNANQSAIDPFEVSWVQGCCLLMRREVYEAIGGLDEGFFLFAEEPDYCERALRVGWATFFVPAAKINHLESNTISRYPERKLRNYHVSPLRYFRKRRKEHDVRILKLGFTLELLLKMTIRFVQSLPDVRKAYHIPIYWRILSEVWRY